jgi:hypothetical protein
MKCAICGDEIKAKGKKLGDGNTVCKDCYESSALIVTCELCEKKVLATSALRDEGTLFCKECYVKDIEKNHDWHSWETWQEFCKEEEEEPVFDEWIASVMESIDDTVKEYGATRIWKKVSLEVAAREIEAAKKAA